MLEDALHVVVGHLLSKSRRKKIIKDSSRSRVSSVKRGVAQHDRKYKSQREIPGVVGGATDRATLGRLTSLKSLISLMRKAVMLFLPSMTLRWPQTRTYELTVHSWDVLLI